MTYDPSDTNANDDTADGRETFEHVDSGSISVEEVDITPEASGTVSLSGNGVTVLDSPASKYGSDYWTVFLSAVTNSGGGRVDSFVSNTTGGNPYLGIKEIEGDPIEVNWAIVKMANQ